MTGAEVAFTFNAKKIGKGKWIAKCPAHPDKKPSLSIDEGKKGVLLYCRSHQCDTKTILAAVGLRFRDLFYMSRDLPSAKLKEIYRQRRVEEAQEKQKHSENLQLWLSSLQNERPERTMNGFERDIDALCTRLEQSNVGR